MESVVHELGVIGEGAAIRGAYLAATSRLLRKRPLCLLRRGAAAGGKNFLLANVLRLIPNESVIVMSSGSPMSLVYYGGGDEDALKHKALYVQEAAILAEKNGVESPLTVMLRLLISEGCVDHHITVPQANDVPLTRHVKRNGPVAVIITSARDNVESEMLTRLLTSDADESPEQTKAVVKGLLTYDDGEGVRRSAKGSAAAFDRSSSWRFEGAGDWRMRLPAGHRIAALGNSLHPYPVQRWRVIQRQNRRGRSR
jgi:hypothetical protein